MLPVKWLSCRGSSVNWSRLPNSAGNVPRKLLFQRARYVTRPSSASVLTLSQSSRGRLLPQFVVLRPIRAVGAVVQRHQRGPVPRHQRRLRAVHRHCVTDSAGPHYVHLMAVGSEIGVRDYNRRCSEDPARPGLFIFHGAGAGWCGHDGDLVHVVGQGDRVGELGAAERRLERPGLTVSAVREAGGGGARFNVTSICTP